LPCGIAAFPGAEEISMPAVMVQGTSSWAGKSLITTALCRHFSRRGVSVAPFKAQNMSNNARVVAGGEIGVAQYLQARAARVEPDVRMNPVLIKPEGPNESQVVVSGQVDRQLSERPWRDRASQLWPTIERSLRSLLAEFELVVMEGAGSPAEINLKDIDLTNCRAAAAAGARVLLVCDIDRGGAFAHLYGTWSLLGDADRKRIGGFVLNKFRGDPSLLAPAPQRLEELTGVPTLGVVPWLEHWLPDEDGAAYGVERTSGGPTVAVVRYPTASNLDEFKLLEQVARVRWVHRAGDLANVELLVLPGSKHVSRDLAWLRQSGLADAVRARAREGGTILGVCGGLQILGMELSSPEVDDDTQGLGLLGVRTTFAPGKLTRQVTPRFCDELDEPWRALAGARFGGYEIRNGVTAPVGDSAVEALRGGLGWQAGAVLGLSVHGLFEDAEVLRRLFGRPPARSLDGALDELADSVTASLDVAAIEQLAGWRRKRAAGLSPHA
jgi:adenosylcobyric acid synthase